jgi:hypothetical protein
MQWNYILGLILLIALIAVFAVISGKGLNLVQDTQGEINWGTECPKWAMSGCDPDKIPLKLYAAVKKDDPDACEYSDCKDKNTKVCNCGSKKTVIDKNDETKSELYCCAGRNEVYSTDTECSAAGSY